MTENNQNSSQLSDSANKTQVINQDLLNYKRYELSQANYLESLENATPLIEADETGLVEGAINSWYTYCKEWKMGMRPEERSQIEQPAFEAVNKVIEGTNLAQKLGLDPRAIKQKITKVGAALALRDKHLEHSENHYKENQELIGQIALADVRKTHPWIKVNIADTNKMKYADNVLPTRHLRIVK